jgi:hypothetical protein
VAGKTDPTIVRTDDALFCGDPHSMSQISWRTPVAHQSTEDIG